MMTPKPNLFAIGGPVHAGFYTEEQSGALCRAHGTAQMHRTSDGVTCQHCISLLEGERFAPFREWSITEQSIYETRRNLSDQTGGYNPFARANRLK